MDIVESVLKVINDKQDVIDHLFESIANNTDFVNVVTALKSNPTFMIGSANDLIKSTGECYVICGNNVVITLNKEKSVDCFKGTRVFIQIGGNAPESSKYDHLIYVPGNFNDYETNVMVDTLINAIKRS